MTILQTVLANLIRSGKVTVEIPNLDMDELKKAVWNEAVDTLKAVKDIVWADEMTDTEKVVWIQERLDLA